MVEDENFTIRLVSYLRISAVEREHGSIFESYVTLNNAWEDEDQSNKYWQAQPIRTIWLSATVKSQIYFGYTRGKYNRTYGISPPKKGYI